MTQKKTDRKKGRQGARVEAPRGKRQMPRRPAASRKPTTERDLRDGASKPKQSGSHDDRREQGRHDEHAKRDGETTSDHAKRREKRRSKQSELHRTRAQAAGGPPALADAADLELEDEALGIGSRVVPPALDFEDETLDDLGLGATGIESGEAEPLDEDFVSRIRDLEARLDGMIARAGRVDIDAEASPNLEDPAPAPRPPEARAEAITETQSADEREDRLEALEELMASPFFRKQWGRTGMQSRVEAMDEFGLDRSLERKLRPLAELVLRRYFRTQIEGIEHVPAQGSCVIVANHSGTFPLDGAMLRAAVSLDHPAHRDLRWLMEDFVFYLPFVGTLLNRIGAVRACPENAERLLAHETVIAVFPEGEKGIRKLYRDRYKLQRFGRGGFVRLCLRTSAPLVPCAIVGSEETHPLLYRLEYLPQLLGLPYLPITPTFPWLGPLGLVPAPSRWKIAFAEPLSLEAYGPEAAEDDVLVSRLAEQVKDRIAEMLGRSLRQRSSVWL